METATLAAIIIGIGSLLVAVCAFLLQRLKYHSELKAAIAVNKSQIDNSEKRFNGFNAKLDRYSGQPEKCGVARDLMRDKLDRRLDKVENMLSSIETKIEPFWQLIKTDIAGLLHRPTHLEMDALLEKLQNGGLDHEEANTLYDMLVNEDNDDDTIRRISTVLVATYLKVEFGISEDKHHG